MSEMNREEAIKDITDNVLPCVGGKSLKMAISDMEKLQKIEALYGIDKFGAVLSREERDMEVQKILEES